jgi:hypothetical protein
MRLRFANPEKTSVVVTLDEGESLGLMAGPGQWTVPTDPANTDYAAIMDKGINIDAYAPPEGGP